MNAPIDLTQFLSQLPILVFLFGALLVPMIGMFLSYAHQQRFSLIVLPLLAIVSGISLFCYTEQGAIFDSMILVDPLSMLSVLVSITFVCLSAPIFFKKSHQKIDEHPTLIASLLLISCVGALLMTSSNHLLLVFVGLEILSIPLYVMTCLHRNQRNAAEASFKYFILGAVASALFVYGMALVWGETGTILISELSGVLFGPEKISDLTVVGFTLLAIGMFFKFGLAPFHMWTPDVYQAAPSALVSWMSGMVKMAAVVVILRFSVSVGHGPFEIKWIQAMKAIAMLSMLWGSLGALFQKNLKRMLAYSSISHAGFMAMGLACAFQGAYEAVYPAIFYYVLSYGLASIVCFAIILLLEDEQGNVTVESLKGLYAKQPSSAVMLSVALLSLAGLPPLAGFFAKYQFFVISLKYGHVDMLIVAMISTVVSLAYYLRIILNLLMSDETSFQETVYSKQIQISAYVAVLAITLLGILPWEVISFASRFWK